MEIETIELSKKDYNFLGYPPFNYLVNMKKRGSLLCCNQPCRDEECNWDSMEYGEYLVPIVTPESIDSVHPKHSLRRIVWVT